MVAIFGVLGVSRLNLRHYPIILNQDFCTVHVWEYIWGTISSLGVFAEGVGKVRNYPLLGLYEFMVLPGRKTKFDFGGFWNIFSNKIVQEF